MSIFSGKVAQSNAFLSPQWGGIVIYNVNKTHASHTIKIDMDTVMQVFISQLKLLLGIKSVVSDMYIARLSIGC